MTEDTMVEDLSRGDLYIPRGLFRGMYLYGSGKDPYNKTESVIVRWTPIGAKETLKQLTLSAFGDDSTWAPLWDFGLDEGAPPLYFRLVAIKTHHLHVYGMFGSYLVNGELSAYPKLLEVEESLAVPEDLPPCPFLRTFDPPVGG